MNKPNQTHLGQFLRSLREGRGYESIQEYVRHYQLPVSYVYYTELEAGKKRIALETAKQLCDALSADTLSFNYHLLQDILPTEVQADFLNLIPVHVSDEDKQANKTQKIKEAYQKIQLSRIGLAIGYMTEEAEGYLYKNAHLMPLVAMIYCVTSTTSIELAKVARNLGITTPIDETIAKFEQLGIIKTAENQANGTKTISRVYDLLVTQDQRIAANRVNAETQLTVKESQDISVGGPNQSSCFYGIVGLSKKKQEELQACIADIDTEFKACHDGHSATDPQLMTIIFSKAREYSL